MYQSFKKIMLESSIEDILRTEFPEIRFNMSNRKHQKHEKSWVELMIVVVQYKNRNKKHGTDFMKRIIELADQEQVDVFLTPDASYSEKEDMSKAQLIKWYRKLGFEKKHRDDFRSQNTYCYYS